MGIGPHLGEIWGFENWPFWRFFDTLASLYSETARQNFTKFLLLTDRNECSNIYKNRKSFCQKLVENAKNLEIWGLGFTPLQDPHPQSPSLAFLVPLVVEI